MTIRTEENNDAPTHPPFSLMLFEIGQQITHLKMTEKLG